MAGGLSGRPYRRLQAWVYDNFDYCLRCGGWVDKDIRYIDPRHPMAPSVDHVIPRARGGSGLSRDNARLSHLGCNAAYRDGRNVCTTVTERAAARGTGVRYRPSRAW
jgi:hypothetical protein